MNSNITLIDRQDNSQSPFDSIRRFDQEGHEHWLARDLQKLLGYRTWQKFTDAIDRAKITCQLNKELEPAHFGFLPGSVKSMGRPADDYRLSRNACYWVAMAGDVRKPEIAAAHQYFAVKTREAELVIPAQSDQIRELELENENLRLREKISARQDTRIQMHGLPTTLLLEGKADCVVQVDRPTIEVIDQRSNSKYEGQTLVQVKDYIHKTTGKKYKSGEAIRRRLEQVGEAGLIAQTPRTITSDYIPVENLEAVYRALAIGDQQQLL
jgi:hypothetical protein